MGVPGHDRLSPGMTGDRILEVPGRGGKGLFEYGLVGPGAQAMREGWWSRCGAEQANSGAGHFVQFLLENV